MTKLSDLELINEILESNCEDSLNELTRRHAALCTKIISYFEPLLKANIEDSDFLTKNKELLVYRAVKSYKPGKGTKFSTWLYSSMKFFFLGKLHRNKTRFIAADDDVLDIITEQQRQTEDRQRRMDFSRDLIDDLKKMDDKRVYEVFKHKYTGEPKRHVEIAQILNTCPSKISRLHISGLEYLRKRVKRKERI